MGLPLNDPTRIIFLAGKGGVGKTTSACATAVGLADAGARVLLVSTDPASNLDEVLDTPLGTAPTPVRGVARLSALNLDPEAAAIAYRERVVGPYRNLLPASAVASIEEQLSGACTVEIAALDEFSKLLGDPETTRDFDHVVFDTAPTGHTLRLLELPAAWTGFLDDNVGGTSCLGPLAGLKEQRDLYYETGAALRNAALTTLVLVARPDPQSLAEAERTRAELSALGVTHLQVILNGVFAATDRADPVALAVERRANLALAAMPDGLRALPRTEVPLRPYSLLGIEALRATLQGASPVAAPEPPESGAVGDLDIEALVDGLAAAGAGVIMTMGKGGVGKTTVAASLAMALARRGHAVTLTTTDPAAHVAEAVGARPEGLEVTRINPEEETRRYTEEVLATAGAGLDAKALAVLEEDLRSPCTEEIAVFRAFADTVALGGSRFVVIDTAPTGHTLLLLDSAEAYHREVLKRQSGVSDAVIGLLPRLRDPAFTRVLLVTLPESTPVHEASRLEADLARAGIAPYAWVVNQSLTPLATSDPVLASRRRLEGPLLEELSGRVERLVLLAWRDMIGAGDGADGGGES